MLDEIERLVGQRIRRARERRGLSQAELGRRTGVPVLSYQTAVSKLEAGQRPLRVGECVALADVLQVPIQELVRPRPAADDSDSDNVAPLALRVPCEVLVLAVRCALTQRSHDVAVVSRSVRDQAHQLPAAVLRELDNRIAYWLDEHPDVARFDIEPWQVALAAVRRARAAS